MDTRSSDKWACRPGGWDSLNTRYVDFDEYPICGQAHEITGPLNSVKAICPNEIKEDSLVDMFLDDYRLERFWNRIEHYIPTFKRAAYTMSPDFSLLCGMPLEMIQWNIYRNRLIGYVYERAGLKVIPTVSWAGPESYPFMTKGIRPGSVIAVSNIGARTPEQVEIFNRGLQEARAQLQPSKIIICCRKKLIPLYGHHNFIIIPSYWDKKRSHGKIN